MYVVKNILVPTDFSDYSAAAIEPASTFAVMYNARLHVLHVVKDPPLLTTRHTRSGAENIPLYRHIPTEDDLGKFVERWLTRLPKVVQAVTYGQPYKEIVNYAYDEDIDLIVIATHGRTGLTHLLMGSVAEKIVRFSTIPVLTVKPPKLIGMMALDRVVHQQVSEEMV
jgi:nucleotide-binding universal stress UspA family protein